MDRKMTGIVTMVIGIILFVVSLFLLLPISEYYVLSLFLMFMAIIMVGVSSAMIKGYDRALDQPSESCYYCGGTGQITKDIPSPETCPRCGGTGLARPDDNKTT